MAEAKSTPLQTEESPAATQPPFWEDLFCARAPARDVAEAWFASLPAEEKKKAKSNSMAAVRELRTHIIRSPKPEISSDRNMSWKYTGSVMRAVDAVLGVKLPSNSAPKIPAVAPLAPSAQSGSSAPAARAPILVVKGDGSPGTLGLWWSDFEAAANAPYLRTVCGVTHRLNVAAEVVAKLPEDDGVMMETSRGSNSEASPSLKRPLVTGHVPMQDVFSDDEDLRATWAKQLTEAWELMCVWRRDGAVVNINCQMGKNRSGATILIWLCKECGWELKEAVAHVRSMNPLAVANPHLLMALGDALGTDGKCDLNPAHDGGGWVCISPPTSPRQGSSQPNFEDIAAQAASKLAGGAGKTVDDPELSDDDLACDGFAAMAAELEGVAGEKPIVSELSDVD
eukprot:TRINITY_DN55424_c0_g1_i1.p1 TRINITY_DN55424_c0_g1~~TRINITY_DN55424_c0_g1_i1.p1  ORF type:complete len:397 (+),score=68.36 TRINITY_DN55424_c0_g1_i1:63-1253(+)